MPFADARGVLARAQQQLSLGELLHGEHFSLYESMTALEVMDPRLDAGMRRPGEDARDAGSVEEAVAAGRAPLDLLPERLTAVMDEVLAAGACVSFSWRQGAMRDASSGGWRHRPEGHAARQARQGRLSPDGEMGSACLAGLLSSRVCRRGWWRALTSPSLIAHRHEHGRLPALSRLTPVPTLPMRGHPAIPTTCFAEAAWYTGYSLAQTVLTCLYVHDLRRTAEGNPVLGAFCAATWHAVCAVKTILETSSVHEEEDFVTYTFGLPGDTPSLEESNAALLSLAAVERALEAPSSEGESASSKGDTDAEAVDLGAAPASWSPEERAAVLLRLRARRHLLGALLWAQDASAAREEGAKALRLAVHALDELRGAYGEGAAPPQPPSEGFDEGVTRRLLAPAPPRKITIARGQEALDYLRGVMEQLQLVAALEWDQATGALGLLEALGRAAPHLKSCIPRGALALRLEVGDDKRVMGACAPLEMVAGDVWLSPTPVPAEAPAFSRFLRTAVATLTNVARIKLCNGGRHRRRLLHCLEDCEVMAQDAAAVDYGPLAAALAASKSSWRGTPWVEAACRHYTVLVSGLLQVQHLLMGCELRLYHESELSMLYWYADYLLGAMGESFGVLMTSGHVAMEKDRKRFDELAAERKRAAHSGAGGDGGSGKGKGKKKDKARPRGSSISGKEAEALEASRRKLAAFQSLAMMSEARRWCCRGIVRLIAALQVGGHLREWKTPFNSGRERFEQRFVVLHRVSLPAPLQYEAYLQSTDASNFDEAQLLGYAGDCFESSSVCLAQLQKHQRFAQNITAQNAEYKALLRAAMTNKTAVEILKREAAKGVKTDLKVTFDYLGGHYAVVKLARTTQQQQQGHASPIVGE